MGLTNERLEEKWNDSEISNAQSLGSQTANWNFFPHVPLTIRRVILGADLSSLRMRANGKSCLVCQLPGYTRSSCEKFAIVWHVFCTPVSAVSVQEKQEDNPYL